MVRIPRTPKRTPEETLPELPIPSAQGFFDPPSAHQTGALADSASIEPVQEFTKPAPLPKAPLEKSALGTKRKRIQ